MRRRTTEFRRGYTLLEMLLALGVIAVFAGMTVPSILRMFRQQKITASAERVREVIASARHRAIESGLIYQFCCEPGGRSYLVVPYELDFASTAGNPQGPAMTISRTAGQFPSGVSFQSSMPINLPNVTTAPTALYGQQKLSPSLLEGLPNSAALSGVNWSAPILFKPDGSANSDTEIIIADAFSQTIRLRVRAFTGAVSMAPLIVGKR